MMASALKKFRRWIAPCLMAVVLPIPQAFAESPEVEIIAGEFGLFDASDPQRVVFQEAHVVPLRKGQRYGWMIEVRTKKRALSVREEYLLPGSASEQFSETPEGTKQVIPLKRHSQISQRQLVPVDGRVFGEWSVGPQEPAGQRQMNVIVEDQVVSFEFEVR